MSNVPAIFIYRCRECHKQFEYPTCTHENDLCISFGCSGRMTQVGMRPEIVVKKDTVKAQDALDIQVGGGHYKDFAIQPAEFIHRNHLGYLQGNVIKYVCRYDKKGNALEDLEKAKHYIDLLISLEKLK